MVCVSRKPSQKPPPKHYILTGNLWTCIFVLQLQYFLFVLCCLWVWGFITCGPSSTPGPRNTGTGTMQPSMVWMVSRIPEWLQCYYRCNNKKLSNAKYEWVKPCGLIFCQLQHASECFPCVVWSSVLTITTCAWLYWLHTGHGNTGAQGHHRQVSHLNLSIHTYLLTGLQPAAHCITQHKPHC